MKYTFAALGAGVFVIVVVAVVLVVVLNNKNNKGGNENGAGVLKGILNIVKTRYNGPDSKNAVCTSWPTMTPSQKNTISKACNNMVFVKSDFDNVARYVTADGKCEVCDQMSYGKCGSPIADHCTELNPNFKHSGDKCECKDDFMTAGSVTQDPASWCNVRAERIGDSSAALQATWTSKSIESKLNTVKKCNNMVFVKSDFDNVARYVTEDGKCEKCDQMSYGECGSSIADHCTELNPNFKRSGDKCVCVDDFMTAGSVTQDPASLCNVRAYALGNSSAALEATWTSKKMASKLVDVKNCNNMIFVKNDFKDVAPFVTEDGKCEKCDQMSYGECGSSIADHCTELNPNFKRSGDKCVCADGFMTAGGAAIDYTDASSFCQKTIPFTCAARKQCHFSCENPMDATKCYSNKAQPHVSWVTDASQCCDGCVSYSLGHEKMCKKSQG